MRKFTSFLCFAVITLFTTACATTVPLQSNFWNRKGATVMVALATLPEAFGPLLRSARMIRGWTQERLGAAAGVDAGAVSQLEREQRQPTWPEAARLLRVLGLQLVRGRSA